MTHRNPKLRTRTTPIGVMAACVAMLLGIAPDAQALPILSEVLYDAAGSDDGSVFVELHGTPGESLEGLRLEGVNGAGGAVTVTISLSGAIAADGFFVLADVTGGGVTFIPGADQLANFDFQNGPDSLVLRSETTVLDALGYGVFSPTQVFAGEGGAAPDPAAGSSLARRFADIDTGDNAADFIVLATPTPGTAPVFGVPEPSRVALLGGVLLAWLPFHSNLQRKA